MRPKHPLSCAKVTNRSSSIMSFVLPPQPTLSAGDENFDIEILPLPTVLHLGDDSGNAPSAPRNRANSVDSTESFDVDAEIDLFDLLERSKKCHAPTPSIVANVAVNAEVSINATSIARRTRSASVATSVREPSSRRSSIKPDISKLGRKAGGQGKRKSASRTPGRPLPRAQVYVEIPVRKFRIVRSRESQSSGPESEVSQALDADAQPSPSTDKSGLIDLETTAALRAENAALKLELEALQAERQLTTAVQPTTQPVVQPAVQRAIQTDTPAATQPVVQPIIQPATQPAVQPAVQSATQPAGGKKTAQAADVSSEHTLEVRRLRAQIERLASEKAVQARALVTLRTELETLRSKGLVLKRKTTLRKECETLRDELRAQHNRATLAVAERQRAHRNLTAERTASARLRSDIDKLSTRNKALEAQLEALLQEGEASDQRAAEIAAMVDQQRSEIAQQRLKLVERSSNVLLLNVELAKKASELDQVSSELDQQRKQNAVQFENMRELETELAHCKARAENRRSRHAREVEELRAQLEEAAIARTQARADAMQEAEIAERLQRECDEIR